MRATMVRGLAGIRREKREHPPVRKQKFFQPGEEISHQARRHSHEV